ncbi:MAG: hypothetical protein K5654_06605 [Lachnospiraceae bacterium]|nr:hypothetical protein [Lachnospiraceae bacterium]
MREISTFFNKDWSEAQIEEAEIFGYNEALNQGINTGEYTFIYNKDGKQDIKRLGEESICYQITNYN